MAKKNNKGAPTTITEDVMSGASSLGPMVDYIRGLAPFRHFPILGKESGHAPFIMSLIFAMVTLFSCEQMAEAQVDIGTAIALAEQCSIDKSVDVTSGTGTLTYTQCPKGKTNDFLREAAQNGANDFNGARLETDILISQTPIFVHGTCKYADVRGTTNPIFIPFNTPEEWAAFIANPPAHVHVADCCVPRAIKVTDAVPPTDVCLSGSWFLLGLVDPTDNTKLIAQPASDDPAAELVLVNGTAEQVDYPIIDLPIDRDDVGDTVPTRTGTSSDYVGKWQCNFGRVPVGHTTKATAIPPGGIQSTIGEIKFVHFRLQCRDADWRPPQACVSRVYTEDRTCEQAGHPAGYTGSVKVLIEHICHGDDAIEAKETVISDTCVSSCTPGQVGDTFTEACPSGQDGIITKRHVRACPAGTVTDEEVSNTCTCPATKDLGTETRNCPDGQTGSIIVRKTQTCDHTEGPVTPIYGRIPVGLHSKPACNGSCTTPPPVETCHCTIKETEESNTCHSCDRTEDLPDTTQACPAGQTGIITIGHKRTFYPSCGQCLSRDESYTKSNTCRNTCTPSEICTSKPCPAGYTGQIVVTTKHICDCAQGRDVVTESFQCTPVCHTCSGSDSGSGDGGSGSSAGSSDGGSSGSSDGGAGAGSGDGGAGSGDGGSGGGDGGSGGGDGGSGGGDGGGGGGDGGGGGGD